MQKKIYYEEKVQENKSEAHPLAKQVWELKARERYRAGVGMK